MKNLSDIFFLIFLFYIYACSYPDIDSVPDFQDMDLTKEEAIDLCNMNSSDNEKILNCLNQVDEDYRKK